MIFFFFFWISQWKIQAEEKIKGLQEQAVPHKWY